MSSIGVQGADAGNVACGAGSRMPPQAAGRVAAAYRKRRYLSIIGVQSADPGMVNPTRTRQQPDLARPVDTPTRYGMMASSSARPPLFAAKR